MMYVGVKVGEDVKIGATRRELVTRWTSTRR